MAEYHQVRDWRFWKGSLEDLAGVAEEAASAISVWAIPEATPTPPVTIRVRVRQERLTTTSDGLSDLVSTPDRYLEELGWIELAIAHGGLPPAVLVTVSKNDPAIRLEVRGPDLAFVQKLLNQLTGSLDRGGRSSFYPSSWGMMIAAILIGLSLGAGFFTWSSLGLAATMTIAYVIGVATALGVIASIWAVFPDLELLPAGQRTRWDRVGRKVTLGVGAAIALLTLIGLFREILPLGDSSGEPSTVEKDSTE